MHFFGLIHKRPGYDQFFAENPFSPADELVFMGLVARSCHFDVTACAEARRLAQRAERPLRGLSALWARLDKGWYSLNDQSYIDMSVVVFIYRKYNNMTCLHLIVHKILSY